MLEQWIKNYKLLLFRINRTKNPLEIYKNIKMKVPVESGVVTEEASGNPE